MLGGLVEYENSDDESGSGEEAGKQDNDDGAAGDEAGDINKGDAAAQAQVSSDSDDEEAGAGGHGSGDDALAAMAAADDKVEDSLRMRIPTSAVAAAAATAATRTPVLPTNPHLAGIVRPANSKQQQQKRRRLLLLDPVGAVGDDSDDDEDEDVVKRRRVAAVAFDGDSRLRGATGLLARLPKPKALAVREGGSRIFVPPQAAAAARRKPALPDSTPQPTPQAEFAECQQVPQQQQQSSQQGLEQEELLGAILPPRELNRYRQATGASLTADNAIRDIRQTDQVADADLRMTKELTRDAGADPRRKPAGPAPTSMAKRKHQITFLAFQAQERELELKNSWADARFNQRNTQNKYGF